MSEAKTAALKARAAAKDMALASEDVRNKALRAMAQALRENTALICDENAQDMQAAQQKGTPDPLLDRLMLNAERIEDIACALESLALLPDPVGRVLEERTLDNGLKLSRVSAPLGVVAMVYEARPNVTADAAGISIKSGNACVLRGGSLALRSCTAIARVIHDAAVAAGLPENCIVAIESADRAQTDELLQLYSIIDVLIPRGGAGLIRHCIEHATVPVIETGVGNCHVYVHESGKQNDALAIIENAKTQRPGVCNACESVLVDAVIAPEFLPQLFEVLTRHNVVMHVDERTLACAQECGYGQHCVAATPEDWATEYLDKEISIKLVDGGVLEAVDHINAHGTKHSEAIVAQDEAAIRYFCEAVDAAALYVNASTRFTDGGAFGLGAEIGISTQKLHVRGPFALEALTTYKYILRGTGQVRA